MGNTQGQHTTYSYNEPYRVHAGIIHEFKTASMKFMTSGKVWSSGFYKMIYIGRNGEYLKHPSSSHLEDDWNSVYFIHSSAEKEKINFFSTQWPEQTRISRYGFLEQVFAIRPEYNPKSPSTTLRDYSNILGSTINSDGSRIKGFKFFYEPKGSVICMDKPKSTPPRTITPSGECSPWKIPAEKDVKPDGTMTVYLDNIDEMQKCRGDYRIQMGSYTETGITAFTRLRMKNIQLVAKNLGETLRTARSDIEMVKAYLVNPVSVLKK